MLNTAWNILLLIQFTQPLGLRLNTAESPLKLGVGSLPTFTSIRVSIIIYCKIAYIFQFSH